jgi:hypothetical protein
VTRSASRLTAKAAGSLSRPCTSSRMRPPTRWTLSRGTRLPWRTGTILASFVLPSKLARFRTALREAVVTDRGGNVAVGW